MDFTNYTGNEEFNKNGFIVVRNLVDKEAFKEDVPSKGNYNWDIHTSTKRYRTRRFHNRLNQSKYSGLVLATKDIIEKALERKVNYLLARPLVRVWRKPRKTQKGVQIS